MTVFGLLLAELFLALGCERSGAPSYDHLRTQLLTDAFAAIRRNNPEKSVGYIDRLEQTYGPGAFTELAAQREQNRLALRRVNSALTAGRLDEAGAVLRTAVSERGRNPALDDARRTVAALAAFDRYLAGRPYDGATEALQQFAELESSKAPLAESETFATWSRQERRRLAAWRRREIRAQVRVFVNKLDEALIAQAPRAKDLVRDIERLMPRHAVVHFWKQLKRTGSIDTASVEDDTAGLLPALELAGSRCWQHIDDRTAGTWWQMLKDTPAETVSGVKLRAILAARTGHDRQAVAFARRYIGKTGKMTVPVVEYLLESVVMDSVQFKARPWRTPFPGASDLFDRLTQIRKMNQPIRRSP